MECEYCDFKADSKNKVRTHVLLRHPDEVDTEEFDAKVGDGFLERRNHPKGESFGYRK